MSACIGPLGEYSEHSGTGSHCENCGEDQRLARIQDYANGLRIWGSDATKQIATDILYLIGEK